MEQTDRVSIPRTREIIHEGETLKSTYFSFHGAYPQGELLADLRFRSVDLLLKRIWRERERPETDDGLGPKYGGHVPLEVLLQRVNSLLNINDAGGKFDARDVYKNWELTWQLLEIRAVEIDGKKKLLTRIVTQVRNRKGNPPPEH